MRAGAALALLATGLSAAGDLENPRLENAWAALETREFSAAERMFAAQTPEPSSIVAHAAALLNAQPRTRDNIQRADQLLATVAPGQSDAAVAARFLRARIAEVHLSEPDYARAAQLYAELIAAFPSHPIAQSAVAKLATLRLYFLSTDPAAELATLEAWTTRLTDRAAQCDFHLVMARSTLYFGGDKARALAHFRGAIDAGLAVSNIEADTLASAGELARELGEVALARQYYERFLRDQPHDQRVQLVRQRLEELPRAFATLGDGLP